MTFCFCMYRMPAFHAIMAMNDLCVMAHKVAANDEGVK